MTRFFSPQAEPQDLTPAVSVLQLFLSSPKPAVRCSAIRTLSEIASKYPRVVSKCNEDLEALIGDANRSIATLAITTLLKTGSENSVDRLLKQISSFLTDIADEYKITIVKSIQQLCLTYPSKHRILVGFLSNFLREEGGFEFKRSIVASIVSLIHTVKETTESSLLHLCEFIEDCEFTMLSTQIIHLLGDLGPKTSAPARYIRFIYNRVILENACVRAAAVSALAKFASQVPSLRTSIMILLQRSLLDEDDETRDRTAIAIQILQKAMDENPYVPPPEDSEEEAPEDVPAPDDCASFALIESMPMSFDKLERSLKAYIATPGAMASEESITFTSLPIVEDYVEPTTQNGMVNGDISGESEIAPELAPPPKEKVDPAAVIYAIPELAEFGRVFRTAAPVPLTESETEYVVSCIKHILPEHIILQFTIENTIDDQRLDNVSVSIDCSDSTSLELVGEIAAPSISYGTTGNCFAVLQRVADADIETSRFACETHFTVVQVDPATGEEEGDSFEEEYPLEDFGISIGDFMAKVSVGDFRRSWDQMGKDNEVLERFALQFKKLDQAVSSVMDILGMQACDGTATMKPNDTGKSHMLHLSGVFIGGVSVLARAQVSLEKTGGAMLKIAVRAEDEQISRTVISSIR